MRGMNVSSSDISAIRNPAARAAVLRQLGRRAPKVVVPKAAMNSLESAYAHRLDTLKLAGEVKWWAFNEIRLRIAGGKKQAWFKPDFAVQFSDGRFEMHESKGFMREAACVRLKVAAEKFPFRFILVTRVAGEWKFEEYGA